MTILIASPQTEIDTLVEQFLQIPNAQTRSNEALPTTTLSAKDLSDKLSELMAARLQQLLQHLQRTCPQDNLSVTEHFEKTAATQISASENAHALAWKTPNNKTLKKALQSLEAHPSDPATLAIQLSNLFYLSLIPKDSGDVSIDFLHGKKAHRRQFGGGMGQHLVRAIGRLEKQSEQSASTLPKVLDATAGLGGDSFVLANLGFSVQMVERDGIVSALLNDALLRAQTSDNLAAELSATFARMDLVAADSRQYLLDAKPEVDTIYMDPMYPEKKKSAATKKEMAALQQRLGPDRDSELLLDAAIQTARYRVVVKRPKGAPVIEHPTYLPTTEIKSPNTRYDIYVIKALKTKPKTK